MRGSYLKRIAGITHALCVKRALVPRRLAFRVITSPTSEISQSVAPLAKAEAAQDSQPERVAISRGTDALAALETRSAKFAPPLSDVAIETRPAQIVPRVRDASAKTAREEPAAATPVSKVTPRKDVASVRCAQAVEESVAPPELHVAAIRTIPQPGSAEKPVRSAKSSPSNGAHSSPSNGAHSSPSNGAHSSSSNGAHSSPPQQTAMQAKHVEAKASVAPASLAPAPKRARQTAAQFPPVAPRLAPRPPTRSNPRRRSPPAEARSGVHIGTLEIRVSPPAQKPPAPAPAFARVVSARTEMRLARPFHSYGLRQG